MAGETTAPSSRPSHIQPRTMVAPSLGARLQAKRRRRRQQRLIVVAALAVLLASSIVLILGAIKGHTGTKWYGPRSNTQLAGAGRLPLGAFGTLGQEARNLRIDCFWS